MKASASPFQGKTAIVSGGTSGIGLSLSRALARQGAHVIIASRTPEKVLEAVRTLGEEGLTVEGHRLDVRDREGFRALARSVVARRGGIDFLFNNAGVSVLGEVRDCTDDDWDDVIDIDLGGVVNGVNAVYPHMIERGSGHIVNVSSVGGLVPTPFAAAYTAAKFGVVGLSEALRLEAERYGVRVSVVCPAAIDTPLATSAVCRHVDRGQLLATFPTKFEDPDACVATILRGIARNRAVIAPGKAGVLAFLHRHAPSLTNFMMKRFVKNAAKVRDAYQAPPFRSTVPHAGVLLRGTGDAHAADERPPESAVPTRARIV